MKLTVFFVVLQLCALLIYLGIEKPLNILINRKFVKPVDPNVYNTPEQIL